MPSISYRRWVGTRAHALDEIEQAHAAIGGTGPGRRYATQQVNQAYAVLLASQFQGFCRDLHTECVDAFVIVATPVAARSALREEFTWGRQLDRGNAQPGAIGADFGRLGIDFWIEVENLSPRHSQRKQRLEELNRWRNAIAHQDFDPAKLGGTIILQLARVRRWRVSCNHLARAFDQVMDQHLQTLTGKAPW
jgi:hypothetical protein